MLELLAEPALELTEAAPQAVARPGIDAARSNRVLNSCHPCPLSTWLSSPATPDTVLLVTAAGHDGSPTGALRLALWRLVAMRHYGAFRRWLG